MKSIRITTEADGRWKDPESQGAKRSSAETDPSDRRASRRVLLGTILAQIKAALQ